jgi:hypothetical protein
MFEEIVDSKFRQLKKITDKLTIISTEEIIKSDLPAFTVNFLCKEQQEINDRETLNSLLEKSVKLSVNYTLRPKWTLVNYLFGGYDSKPAEEILKKAEIFQFYRYYVDLITNHIKDHSLMFITQDEFKALTDDANKAVLEKLVKETSSIKIKNFFSQIYKIKYGDDREINLDWSIPFLFIKLFLEDKDFPDLLNKFQIIPGLDDSMEIEMKTAIKVLTNKYYVNSDFFVLKDEPQNKISDAANTKSEKETKTNVPENNEKIEKPGKIDLTEEISNKTSAEKTPPVKQEIKDENEDEKPGGVIRIIKNIPAKRFRREKKPAEKKEIEVKEEQVPELKEEKEFKSDNFSDGTEKIKHLFKEDEKSAILKKIFKGSKSAMYEAFDELEKLKTWQDASGFLKELFKKNKVDLYNKRIVLFIDILNDHFIEREKGK